MCIYNVFLSTGLELVEDFIDEIEKICMNDSDLSTKRNAFMLIFLMD
jgi:coatomer subunit beta